MFIPLKWKTIVFKKDFNNLIIIYNNLKKIKITFKQNKWINYNKETNCISFFYLNTYNNITKAVNELNKITFSFDDYFAKKIKFKGKGFRLKIKKIKKAIKLMFGHSHLNIFFLKNVKLKKSSKYKFFIKSTNVKVLNHLSSQISNIKPINPYTNRGLRTARQIILKRKGKKGSYV